MNRKKKSKKRKYKQTGGSEGRVPAPFKFPGPPPGPPPNPKFNLMSWNIFFKLSQDESRKGRIISYITQKQPDILFIQESHTLGPIQNYEHEGNKSLGIYYNSKTFSEVGGGEVQYRYLADNYDKTYGKDTDVPGALVKTLEPPDSVWSRQVMAMVLQHNDTGENIIFINLWAPHYLGLPGKLTELFKAVLLELIQGFQVSVPGARIIIAGDFNELYPIDEDLQKSKKMVLGGEGGEEKFTLYLKQSRVTCCGHAPDPRPDKVLPPGELIPPIDDLVPYIDGFIRGKGGKGPGAGRFDLVFDSVKENKLSSPDYKMRISDHYPVMYSVGEKKVESSLVLNPKKAGEIKTLAETLPTAPALPQTSSIPVPGAPTIATGALPSLNAAAAGAGGTAAASSITQEQAQKDIITALKSQGNIICEALFNYVAQDNEETSFVKGDQFLLNIDKPFYSEKEIINPRFSDKKWRTVDFLKLPLQSNLLMESRDMGWFNAFIWDPVNGKKSTEFVDGIEQEKKPVIIPSNYFKFLS